MLCAIDVPQDDGLTSAEIPPCRTGVHTPAELDANRPDYCPYYDG
jgi:hypothetical protein